MRNLVDWLAQDTRVALRGLRRTPAFVVTVVAILGIAVGMTTAMTSVFSSVIIQRLPVHDQDHLVLPRVFDPNGVEIAMFPPDFDAFQRSTRTLSAVAGVAHWGAIESPLRFGTRELALRRAIVTGNFFDVLGVRPALGRLLEAEDDVAGAEFSLVLSYRAWQRDFGGDSSIVGKRLIDPYFGASHPVIGVAPAGLDFPSGTDTWVAVKPLGADILMTLVGRLAPQATLASAASEFISLRQQSPSMAEYKLHLARSDALTLAQAVFGDARVILVTLTAAVALLLLIACVNVGNLVLLRAASRSRELAIRRAIGANYADIVRQLVVESGVLGIAGGALGLLLAVWLLRALVWLAPAQLPRMDVVTMHGTPAGLAILITFVAVALFGLAPALTAARVNLASSLRLDARSGLESRSRRAVRRWLVASQVALALIMLSGAALLARSLDRLQRVNLGYQPEHMAIFTLAVPMADTARPLLNAHFDAVAARLRSLPGVVALSPILIPPFHGTDTFVMPVEIEGQTPTQAAANPFIPWEVGDASLFRVLGLPVVRGRGFSDDDRENAPDVVVISESFARRYWSGEDPIGKRLRSNPSDKRWRTVVGIVADTRYRNLRQATSSIYFPWRQQYWQGSFAARLTTDLGAMLPAMRREVNSVDSRLSIWQARTMNDFIAEPLAQPRLSTVLLTAFGLVALILASLGLYGVMASAVREQTRELGVRMALGATPERLRRDVLAAALRVTTAGAVVGLVGALFASRLLAKLLFETSPIDPAALSGATALLIGVSLLAAFFPARRATRIDPAQALRAD